MRKVMLAAIAGASTLTAPAAAAPEAGDAPAQAPSPTRIVYVDEGMSRMSDLPMGVHRIPDSNVIVSGHQKGGGIGMLFGIVGVAIQSSANASGGTARVRNVEDDLRFNATAKANELTGAILADGKFGQRFTLQAADSMLNVVPYIVITFRERDRGSALHRAEDQALHRGRPIAQSAEIFLLRRQGAAAVRARRPGRKRRCRAERRC